jgi:hypothetical protein
LDRPLAVEMVEHLKPAPVTTCPAHPLDGGEQPRSTGRLGSNAKTVMAVTAARAVCAYTPRTFSSKWSRVMTPANTDREYTDREHDRVPDAELAQVAGGFAATEHSSIGTGGNSCYSCGRVGLSGRL